MKADLVNSSALVNIQRLIKAREDLVNSLMRSHRGSELQKRYMELDMAFINAIKAESKCLSSIQEEEESCKQN